MKRVIPFRLVKVCSLIGAATFAAPRVRIVATVLFISIALGQLLVAQDSAKPSTPSTAEQSDLTQGLLDLLGTPKSEMPKPAMEGSTGPSAALPLPDASGLDSSVGPEGEDLGQSPANPLEAVRQSMLIAAGFLGRGAVGADTQQLQGDIVQSLDDLIAQLENSDSSESNSKTNPAPDSSSKQEQTTQQSSQNGNGEEEASQRESPQGSSPSNNEKIASGEGPVDLADPKALQQSVWGHLPERMRTQMQSRMVEQFLPSYREQIEAYFKALLENE